MLFCACLRMLYYFPFFLKRNALRESDWIDKALITPQRTAQQVIDSIPHGMQTALVDNAAIISKQASKYSTQCGLIMLCNYQKMIVLDFTPGPGNTAYNDRPQKAPIYGCLGKCPQICLKSPMILA